MNAKRITDRSFFTCPAEELAPKLLGKVLCRKAEDGFVIRGRINVTEAYPTADKVNDAARAAKSGKVNTQMQEGGVIYVKNSRGSFRFDIVAGHAGDGESVLIRGLDAYTEGPFIAADAMSIDSGLDGTDLLSSESLIWVEDDGVSVELNEPRPRVLGEKAPSESAERLLRFTVKAFTFN